MHRADYQRALADEVRRLGVQVRLGAEVVKVECNDERPTIILSSGEKLSADVIVGADGLRSEVRTAVLGYVKEPEESGDLAYRITIPRELLENDPDPFIRGIVNEKINASWWGQHMHVVLYSVRGDQMANLVLMYDFRPVMVDSILISYRCPDNLPAEVSRQPGSFQEMHELFKGWDPRLQVLLSKVSSALKWKVWVMEELGEWTKVDADILMHERRC